MKVKFYNSSIIIYFCLSSCSPTTNTAARKTSSGVVAGAVTGTSVGVSAGSETASSGSEGQSSSSNGQNSSSNSTIVSSPDSSLNAMSQGDLVTYYNSRKSDLTNHQNNVKADNQIVSALCSRLSSLRAQCAVANPLLPGTNLICKSTNIGDGFSVQLTDTSGNPLKKVDGQYAIVINGNYISTPFGAGNTHINFSFHGGVSGIQSPTIGQVTLIEIKRADENMSAIASGKAQPIINNFYVQLFFNGVKIADGPLLQDSNTSFKNYRYMLSLDTILAMQRSSMCTVQAREIDNIKTQITSKIASQSVQSEAASVFSPVSTSTPKQLQMTKSQLISEILALEHQISTLLPRLDTLQNEVMNLTNELQTTSVIGCHASEPIVQLSVTIVGKKNDPKAVSDVNKMCPSMMPGPSGSNVLMPLGSGNIISVDMGSSVTVNLDQNTAPIGGPPWVGQVSEQAVVGNIQYLSLKKLGVTIDDLGPRCTSGFLGANSSCTRICQEIDTYTITGIKIAIDTPSVTGFTIYDASNLNIILGSTLYSSNAVLSWQASNLRSDPNWNKLMYDTNCQTTK